MHVLGKWNQEKEDTDGEHVGPIGRDDHGRGWNEGGGNPSADGLPGRGNGGLAGLDHERCRCDGHDEQQDDVAFELGLALEFLRGEHNTTNQGQDATDKGDDVADFNHQIPWPSHDFWQHLLRKLVAAGEIKHVGGEHEETPEHEDVNATGNTVFEHLLLSEPTREHLGNPSTPIVESVLWLAFENKA